MSSWTKDEIKELIWKWARQEHSAWNKLHGILDDGLAPTSGPNDGYRGIARDESTRQEPAHTLTEAEWADLGRPEDAK